MAGMLLLTACPQMTTSAVGTPGGPLSAGGEEKTVSEKVSDSEEVTAPPSAAAPIPPPPAGGGGDPAGTTPPPTEPAFHRIGGSGAGGETPIPISGPLASGDRGLISAPTIREAIDTPADNLRILFWPASARRNWTNAEDFFTKLRSGNIAEETAKQAKAQHMVALICPTCPSIDADSPAARSEEEIPSKDFFATEPGYYLFFITEEGLYDMGPESVDVTSTAHLKGLVRLDQADPDGHEFRMRFLGERTIFSRFTIDPSMLRQPFPGLPSGSFPLFLETVPLPR